MEERCVSCGEIVPEGVQVCRKCMMADIGRGNGMIIFDLYPRKCKMCGKKFESSVDYAYKKSKGKHKKCVYFCSYTCMRAWEKEHD